MVEFRELNNNVEPLEVHHVSSIIPFKTTHRGTDKEGHFLLLMCTCWMNLIHVIYWTNRTCYSLRRCVMHRSSAAWGTMSTKRLRLFSCAFCFQIGNGLTTGLGKTSACWQCEEGAYHCVGYPKKSSRTMLVLIGIIKGYVFTWVKFYTIYCLIRNTKSSHLSFWGST